MLHKAILSLLFISLACSLWAQETHWVNNSGLGGEMLVSVAAGPGVPERVLLGTENGLFRLDATGKAWQPVCGTEGNLGRVQQILMDEFSQQIFAATDEGLWSVDPISSTCRKIFEKSAEAEKNCLSVSVAKNGKIYLGTAGGLFIRDNGQWAKESSSFDDKTIVSLENDEDHVYAATDSSVYIYDEKRKQWQKILNIYMFAEPQDTEEFSSDEEGPAESMVRDLMVVRQKQKAGLYAATSRGIFVSKDRGQTWDRLPLAGLDYVHVRNLFYDINHNAIYAVCKSGLYMLEETGWSLRLAAYDARMAVVQGERIILISTKDIFEYMPVRNPITAEPWEAGSGTVFGFNNEPTIRQVQQMAIEYAEVSNKKIQNWRRRSQWKAFLPDLSIDYDKTVTTALGATYNRSQVGPRDWGMSLKWDLSDFIYSSDQTSIDTRSKLMVELRNDILSEVTRLYFERRKLQIELARAQTSTEKDRLDKGLRIAELSAMIDRLTGGEFSDLIKSFKK